MKLFLGFLVYGIVVGAATVFWWCPGNSCDSLFPFNVPGQRLGEETYGWAIRQFGDPTSPQAHYTIPSILRIPEVYLPTSIVFWGGVGLLLGLAQRLILPLIRGLNGRQAPGNR